MRNMKKIVPLGVLAAAVCMLAGYSITTHAEEDNKIADKVTISGIEVGGMTEEEAAEEVSAYVEEALDATFTLEAGDNSVEVTAEEIGLEWSNTNVVSEAVNLGKIGNLIQRYKDKKDLENEGKDLALKYSIDEELVSALLDEKADTLNTEVVNNGLKREDGKFVFIEGQSGVEVNVEESLVAITDYLNEDWDGEDAAIELVAEVVEPEGTKEELEKVQDVLGSYSTNYSTSGAARCHNIDNAVSRINGTVLYPGETFSTSETMGERTAENGYELAGAYENGQTVEAYGGGVCQVSTTLYNAVLLSELEVVERSNHSMIVNYVKPSMDAAIAGDYKDFKFENNTDAPIYIEGYTSGKNVYFTIYGEDTREAGRTVSYESEVVSQEDPETQFVLSGDFPLGYYNVEQSAHTGYHARLWKVVTVNGAEESREEVNSSVYKPSSKIVTIGIATDNAEAVNAINAAVATGDEETVKAAIAQYATPAETTTETPTADAAADAAATTAPVVDGTGNSTNTPSDSTGTSNGSPETSNETGDGSNTGSTDNTSGNSGTEQTTTP
ncbi:MAG: VanW family protein [Roseburia sp.]